MTENKTKKTSQSAAGFLNSIDDPQKRADCKAIARMMRAATGNNARMWGASIVGYGTYEYRNASGREGSFFLTGLSPRARNISVYIMPGFSRFESLMAKLGKYKTGKSCLYIHRLRDVDEKTLKTLIERSIKYMRNNYHCY